jgi:hypothetical protein
VRFTYRKAEHFEPGRYLSEYRHFTYFSRLPTELRRHIWLHALQPPRVLKLDYYVVNDRPRDEETRCELHIKLQDNQKQRRLPTQLRLVCKESYEVFAEHYGCLTINERPAKCLTTLNVSELTSVTRPQLFSHHFISFKLDTLVVHDFERLQSRLSEFELQLDLSSLKKLAITGFHSAPRTIAHPSMWRIIEQTCPLLEYLNVVIDPDRPMAFPRNTLYNFADYAHRFSEARKNSIVSKFVDIRGCKAIMDHSRALNCRKDFSVSVQPSYAKRVELDISRLCYFQRGRKGSTRHRMYFLEIHIKKDFRVLYLKDRSFALRPSAVLDQYCAIKELFE